MSSAGTSGASNAEMGNQTGASLNGMPEGMENVGDEPVETIEVIEVIETSNPYEYSAAGDLSGFKWWYVPAVALPIIAGGAIFWYSKNGQQPFLDAKDLLARKGDDFKELLQDQTKRLPGKASDVKGKSAAAVGAVATAGLLNRIGDTVDDIRGSASDLAQRAMPRERLAATTKATRSQIAQVRESAAAKQAQARAKSKWNDFTDMVGSAAAGAAGWVTAQRLQDRAKSLQDRASGKARDLKLQQKAKVAKKATKTGAIVAADKSAKAVAKANDKAAEAAHKTRKRARAAWRRTRAFTFGMLVTATTMYVRLWRQRIAERTTRETAGGRLVRDA